MHVFLISAFLALQLLGCDTQQDDVQTAISGSPVATGDVAAAHAVPADSTLDDFERVMQKAQEREWHRLEVGKLMQEIGLLFLDAPYAEGLLDEDMEERLVVNLRAFDCVTYVETVLALARGILDRSYAYSDFEAYLEDQRYRDGTIDGYCSRLHYFTDWIADNDARGNVRDLTRELGGQPMDDLPTFMTSNRAAYMQLAASDSLYQEMQRIEERIADQSRYFIPQDQIAQVYDRLEAGDILAFATDIGGLDVSHTGLVFKGEDGSTGVLHASLEDGVKVSPDLQNYVQNNRRQIGIVVARPSIR